MKQHLKKLSSSLLVLLMVFSMMTVSNAASTVTSNGGSGDSAVVFSTTADGTLEGAEGAIAMSVTVPTSLPMAMGPDGAVTTATNAQIVNNSHAPVKISSVSIEAASGWSLCNYTDRADFASKKANSKQFAFGLKIGNGTMHSTDDSDSSEQYLMTAPETSCYLSGVEDTSRNTVAVTYEALVAPFVTVKTNETIATVLFTIQWDI